MHRALILTAVTTPLMCVVLAGPAAWADTGGTAWNNGSYIGAGAQNAQPGGAPGPTSGGGSSASSCTYAPLSAQDQQVAADLAANSMGPGGNGPGTWYREICTYPNGTSSGQIVWAPAAAPVVNLNALAQQAANSVPLPSPTIRMNPAVGQEQVVHMTTWLWINKGDWQPVSATATAGPVSVTATATPESVVWRMGDGVGDVVCDGPGTAYDRSRAAASQTPSCSYEYTHASSDAPGGAFQVTATITYHVTWVATGAPGGGDLGVANRTATVPVRVAEIQAINGPSGQEG
jgi:hypothetical protein